MAATMVQSSLFGIFCLAHYIYQPRASVLSAALGMNKWITTALGVVSIYRLSGFIVYPVIIGGAHDRRYLYALGLIVFAESAEWCRQWRILATFRKCTAAKTVESGNKPGTNACASSGG